MGASMKGRPSGPAIWVRRGVGRQRGGVAVGSGRVLGGNKVTGAGKFRLHEG